MVILCEGPYLVIVNGNPMNKEVTEQIEKYLSSGYELKHVVFQSEMMYHYLVKQ